MFRQVFGEWLVGALNFIESRLFFVGKSCELTKRSVEDINKEEGNKEEVTIQENIKE